VATDAVDAAHGLAVASVDASAVAASVDDAAIMETKLAPRGNTPCRCGGDAVAGTGRMVLVKPAPRMRLSCACSSRPTIGFNRGTQMILPRVRIHRIAWNGNNGEVWYADAPGAVAHLRALLGRYGFKYGTPDTQAAGEGALKALPVVKRGCSLTELQDVCQSDPEVELRPALAERNIGNRILFGTDGAGDGATHRSRVWQ
jgi:hypothetical protein